MLRLRLFKTVQWKLVVIYILLIVMAMQFIGAYFTREVESYYTNTFSETLNSQATLLSTLLGGIWNHRTARSRRTKTTVMVLRT